MLEIRCLFDYPVDRLLGKPEYSTHSFNSMALIRSASSLSATFASQAPRVAPVVLNRVSGALSYNNRNAAPVQRRTFLVGTIINLSFGEDLPFLSWIDAVFLTTAASAMRRVSGIE